VWVWLSFFFQKHHAHHEVFSVWATTPSDMSDLGPGITLYFYFVRLLALVFSGMCSQPGPRHQWRLSFLVYALRVVVFIQ
jgi:hypothetical protein